MTPIVPQRESVKHITCFYWNRGSCRYSERDCLYAHHRSTERVAEAPIRVERGQPAVAGRNARRSQPEYIPWRSLPAPAIPRPSTQRAIAPPPSPQHQLPRLPSQPPPHHHLSWEQQSPDQVTSSQLEPSRLQQNSRQQLLPEKPFHQQLPHQLPSRPRRVQELRSGDSSGPVRSPARPTNVSPGVRERQRPATEQPSHDTMAPHLRTFRELRATIEQTIQQLVTMANNLLAHIRQLQLRVGLFGAVPAGIPALALVVEINDLVRGYRVLTDQMDAILRRLRAG